LEWLVKNIGRLDGDINRIFVAGDSAGGNLAAVLALQARAKFPGVIKGQVLIYPVTDHYSSDSNTGDSSSYSKNNKDRVLTKDLMIWFWDLYFKNSNLLELGQTQHELSTPLRVKNLSCLPPTLILIADRDPLKDEAFAYADKLLISGIEVQHTLYKGTQHGFMGGFGPSRNYEKGCLEIVTWLDSRN